jgi:hypothetical protein
MRKCLEICRLDENRPLLLDAWNGACEAERDAICKSLQCRDDGPVTRPNFD